MLTAAYFRARIVADPVTGCWNWKLATTKGRQQGYGVLRVGGKWQRAHRASYRVHKGTIPGDQQVLHTCDNRRCVNPAHLYLGTNDNNVDDRESRGRRRGSAGTSGEDNPAAKLTEAKVAAIRAERAAGRPRSSVASRYGVSVQAISNIDRGVTWKKTI